MKFGKRIINKAEQVFRRETASTDFIPVIDGLRFLAILMVVGYHVLGYLADHIGRAGGIAAAEFAPFRIFEYGNQGVQLFFVISGFVLALPFLRYHFGLTDRKVEIGWYFKRRLSRLEPPYIVSTLLLCLLLAIVVNDKYPLSDLLLSLVASLLYISNFVFPGELPHINSVTWSLEIEVQFYLIAPILAGAAAFIRPKVARRIALVSFVIAFAVLSWFLETGMQVRVLSLAMFMQYFLAGVLLCDIYLLDTDWLRKLNGAAIFLVGLVILLFLLFVGHSVTPNLPLKILSPLMILAFYLIVFGNVHWNRAFSFRPITLIGGMCYSIYLLHTAVISGVGRLTVPRFQVGELFVSAAVQFIILFAAVLIVSSVFFLLIEKPCMKREWYTKLYRNLKSALAAAAAERSARTSD